MITNKGIAHTDVHELIKKTLHCVTGLRLNEAIRVSELEAEELQRYSKKIEKYTKRLENFIRDGKDHAHILEKIAVVKAKEVDRVKLPCSSKKLKELQKCEGYLVELEKIYIHGRVIKSDKSVTVENPFDDEKLTITGFLKAVSFHGGNDAFLEAYEESFTDINNALLVAVGIPKKYRDELPNSIDFFKWFGERLKKNN